MLLLTRYAVMALLATTACSTTDHPRTADSACVALRTLTYAGAKSGQETADDPGNRYDTALTVAGIAEHNARWRAMCQVH